MVTSPVHLKEIGNGIRFERKNEDQLYSGNSNISYAMCEIDIYVESSEESF